MSKPIFNEKTKRGVMVSTEHRKVLEGEFSPTLSPEEFELFTACPQRYGHIDGVFTDFPNWEAEKNEKIRGRAFENLKARIIAKRQEKNDADFTYLGNTFVSDEANIQGVKVGIEGLPDSDPIPTFGGETFASTWVSADNTFVPFNCGTFRTFADFYLKHRSKNFTNYTKLTIAATMAYAAGATVEEMQNFDISQGWD